MTCIKRLFTVLLTVILLVPTQIYAFANGEDGLVLQDNCIDNSVRFSDNNVWYFAPGNQDYGYTNRIRFYGADSFLIYRVTGYDISKIEIVTVAYKMNGEFVNNASILASEDGINYTKMAYNDAVDAVPNPTIADGKNNKPLWHKFVYTIKNIPFGTTYIKIAPPEGYPGSVMDIAQVSIYGKESDGIARFAEPFDSVSGVAENAWFIDKELSVPFNLSITSSIVTLLNGESINKSLSPSVNIKEDDKKEYWLGMDFKYTGIGNFGAEIGEKIFVGIKEKGSEVYPYISCGDSIKVYGDSTLQEDKQYKIVAAVTPSESQVNLGIIDEAANSVVSLSSSLEDVPEGEYSLLSIENDGFDSVDIDSFAYEAVGTGKFNEYCEDFWNARKNPSYANASSAKEKILLAPECMMKNAYIYTLNQIINEYVLAKSDFETRLNAFLDVEINDENLVSQYAVYQDLLAEKVQFETNSGDYDATFSNIEKKFLDYKIFLTRFEEKFADAGQVVGNDWFDDDALTIDSDVVITENENVILQNGKSINRELSEPIKKTDGEGGHWFGVDLSYNGASNEFNGISLGDFYYFGMKQKDGYIYPYIGTKAEGEGTYTDVYTFTDEDVKKFYSSSNVSAHSREGDTKFPEEKNSLRNSTDGDGNFVIEVDRPTSISIYVIRHQNVSGCYPEIYVSNDLYSWTNVETTNTFISKDVDYEKWNVAADIPESTKYIKVSTPIARRADNSIIANWASALCGMNIKGLSDSTTDNEVYGTTKLDQDVNYTFIASVESSNGLMGLFVYKDGELIDKLFKRINAPDMNIQAFTLKSGANGKITADNVVLEYIDLSIWTKECSLFEKAVITKKTDDIKNALLQAQSAQSSLMKTAHISALNALKTESGEKMPVINYISLEGNLYVGNTIKALVNYTDEYENLKEFNYKWYIGNAFCASTQSFTIPSDAAGKGIKLEVVPITKSLVYGETAVYNDTIKKPDVSSIIDNSSAGSSSGWGGGSGSGGSVGVSGIGGVQAITIPSMPISNTSSVSEFEDVKGHWAENAIVKLTQMGIIKGVSESEFDTESNINRGSVAALISRIIADKKTNTISNQYTDVNSNDWYYNDILNVTASGIMMGDEGNFNPEKMITRQEMAKVLYELCRVCGVKKEENEYQDFNDDEFISDWAKEAVYYCRQMGLISGYENNFRPNDNLTRAETASLLYRFEVITGKISN